MIFSKLLISRFGVLLPGLLTVSCATPGKIIKSEVFEPRWINSTVFDATDHETGSLYSFTFDMDFTDQEEKNLKVKDCLEVGSIGSERIASREFTRWVFLNTNCEIVKRFYHSPKESVSYWPNTFDYSLLKALPASAIPYLGGQGLDGRVGTLSAYDASLTLVEAADKNRIVVDVDDMVVDYVQVARADFNRDGVQDIFIRMDWYVKDAFGNGTDWVVLTKLSPDAAPMMLWRK